MENLIKEIITNKEQLDKLLDIYHNGRPNTIRYIEEVLDYYKRNGDKYFAYKCLKNNVLEV